MVAKLLIPIASYWSIERLSLIYFSCAQQDHKLNGTGIIIVMKEEKRILKNHIRFSQSSSVRQII
jgi:hypothetical protein